MPKPNIEKLVVIEVQDGIVTNVYSGRDCEVIILDRDTTDDDGTPNTVVKMPKMLGDMDGVAMLKVEQAFGSTRKVVPSPQFWMPILNKREDEIFKSVIEGLQEFYPILHNPDFVALLREQVVIGETFDPQDDYQDVRNQVEKILREVEQESD